MNTFGETPMVFIGNVLKNKKIKKKEIVKNPVAERLKLVVTEKAQGRPTNFANLLGVNSGMVAGWLNRGSSPGGDHLKNICLKLDVNINWLLTGKGEKYLNKKEAPKTQNGYVSVPLLEVIASAGPGAIVPGENVTEDLKFRKEWFAKELRVNWQNIKVITVEGASMTPELNHGDMAFVDITDNINLKDCIYVIRVDDNLLVKKVQVLPGKKIKIISVNPAFEPYTITLGESENFAIVGRVVWSGRKL